MSDYEALRADLAKDMAEHHRLVVEHERRLRRVILLGCALTLLVVAIGVLRWVL